ncbi:hypothetical protein Tco_0728470 [Tanacetum coccineum]|uniref:Reverse transcriptase domain-containing protein n=1 Tax=Tanacetum coccineum TaxID=301880 RepID=A0ABQ4YL88_9ASTR
MRTRSSSNLIAESSTTPKRRNRRRSKQRVEPFSLEETSVVTMADQRTMAELLQAPTEGYGDAIVIPAILAENFELKHGLLNLVTSKQFYGFEKEDPHAHIRCQFQLNYSDEGQMFVEFLIQNQLFSYSLETFAQILDVPCQGACVFTDSWRLDELAYGNHTDGPYQTNLPLIEDIILSIRIDREGQVLRIRHEEEIDVLEYQILTREIVQTLKPLEEIIRENVFCLGGNRDHVPTCLCFMLYCLVHSEKFNLAYYMAKRIEWVTKQARLILPYGRPSTSSSTFDQPSSSHLNDDDDDENNKGTSRAKHSFPTFVKDNSLTNQVPQVFQNPHNSVPTKGLYKTKPPSPRVIKSHIQIPRQGQETRTKNKVTIVVGENEILTREIRTHMKPWVEIIRENVFCQGGHKDHVSACLCHMLYCIETSTPYNLAFFILKRMERTRFKPKELLPYGMLLTRLFKHVVSISPELAFDHYLSHDRAMHPLAPHYERKTRADRGKKRPREPNASSSSTTQNPSSSSLQIDVITDDNDVESPQSNSSSPSQTISSSSNVVSGVHQNPPHENHDLNNLLSQTISFQIQQRDEHRDGLRSGIDGSVIALQMMDKVGRMVLLLWSFFGMESVKLTKAGHVFMHLKPVLKLEPFTSLHRTLQVLEVSGTRPLLQHFFLSGVLVRSGLSRVWRNPMCDPVLRRSDNTGTSILGRVADRTTSPAPAGIAIPHASLEEIVVTRPDPKVVTKADHVAKRKTSTGSEISTNTAKRTRLSQKVSGAGSSGLAAGDGVEQTDDGTLDDDGQRNGSEFAMEDIGNLNDVSQGEHINVIPLRTFDPSLGLDVTYPLILLPDKEVEAHAELSGGVRRTTRASSHASHGKLVSSFTFAFNYTRTRVRTTLLEMCLERSSAFCPGTLLRFLILMTRGSRSEFPPYTKDDWEEIHGFNLGLQRKELYKDPKVCRTALDRFPALVETHRLRELSSVELSDRISTQTIKKQRANLKQQGEFTIHANEEVSRLKTELGALKSKCESDFTPLVRKFLKSGEFNQAFASVLNIAISVGVERGLRIDRIDEEFRGLSQKVSGFIPDAKEKFDRVIDAFPDTTFPFLDKISQHSRSSLQDIARLEPDRVTSSHQPSSAIASLRANTHMRHSTSSSGTFGHTSTPEQLKKKKKSVEKGGPSAA